LNLNPQNPRNKTIILIGALIYMIVNSLFVLLVCNTEFILVYDRIIWSTRIILIISGLSFVGFFFILRFIDTLNIQKLFLIFLIIKVVVLYFLIAFNYLPGIQLYYSLPPHVLNGDIFTPYTGSIEADLWRSYPPMFIWWYTFNSLVYGLNEVLWRIVNLLLEVGIVYVMIRIFGENLNTEKGWTERNFKIGLSFYIFSFIPIVAFLLWANAIVFYVLLYLLGFLYFFRSKKNSKYLYYALFFFTLATFTEGITVYWLFAILLIMLFQRNFKQLLISIGEILAIFCLLALPFLINDALGYVQHLLSFVFQWQTTSWDGNIWIIKWGELLNLPNLFNSIPLICGAFINMFYIYKNYKSEKSLDLFIIVMCIFIFFGCAFNPWHYPWIFPLICINIIYSLRKFLIANLFFVSYFLFFILWFLSAYLTYPTSIYPDPRLAFPLIFMQWMPSMGYFVVLPLIVQITYQLGLLYLIYSYTKSKKLVLLILIPYMLFYIINLCLPANLSFDVV